MTLKYKAVLFDLDGTLLNTLQDLAEAVNGGLISLGLPPHAVEDFKQFVGEGREEMVRKALPQSARDSATVKQVVDFVNRFYAEHWRDHTLPYPGIPELLDALVKKGVGMAIFSNKPQEFTTQNVEGLLAAWHFERVLGASDSVPKKPDCSAALRIATEMGLKASDFIYLGDSGIDMQTATRAGMYPVGALWGFRSRTELLENGARALVVRPPDLLKLL
jgi:phosphoglycolate phosphatase